MKESLSKLERFLCSWWLFVILIALQFVAMPVATRNFSPELSGDIIRYTLGHALIQGLYKWSWIWQSVTLVFICLAFVLKGKFTRQFMLFAGISYLVYMVIQNVAVTELYGVSTVTSNIIAMGLTAFVWLRDVWKRKTSLDFANLNGKTWWLIGILIFCLWWPMNMKTVSPSFNPVLLLTGGSAMAYCAMTPVFLIILILNKPSINLVTYRVTAVTGTLIGIWNMTNFGDPATIWLGIYHLPLLLLSVYALVDSWRIKKRYHV